MPLAAFGPPGGIQETSVSRRHPPASTPAATDFSRASCPDLNSRCLSGLGCRTSGSPQPHRQRGFWIHAASAAALAFRTSHARLAPSVLLVFIANLRFNLSTLRCLNAIFSACYRWLDASVWFSTWFSWCVKQRFCERWTYENVRPKAWDVVLRVFQEYVSVHLAPFSGLWSRELRSESSPGSQTIFT